MATASEQPDVGVGVFVINSRNEFLIGRRKGCVGSGGYGLPGGHLEIGESFEDCAARETLEEAGIHIVNPQFLVATTGVYFHKVQQIHYVAIFMTATLREEDETKVENREPDKCEGWEWISWKTMVEWAGGNDEERTLFPPLTQLLRQRPDVVPTR